MKLFVLLGSCNMFLAVALGAFGAHGLKKHVAEELLTTWNTSVFYHVSHSLALILVGILIHLLPSAQYISISGWFLLAGIVLFSGSLYVLVISGLKPLGMITPLGGISFLIGWLFLAAAMARLR